MAFMGMFIGGIAIIILIIIAFFAFVFLTAAIILKIVGRKKNSKPMRITGNVFLVLGILNAIPILYVIGLFIFNSVFTKITLPNETTAYVYASDIDKMTALAEENTPESLQELDALLTRRPKLIYYQNINRMSVIDYGLENSSAQLVKIALAHGSIFDDSRRFDHMSFENSMDYYIGKLGSRKITDDDVEILRLMFENGASVELNQKQGFVYSNAFGEAVWSVLYNDEAVTDTELEFLQVFSDNGVFSDSALLLYEEKPNNIFFSDERHFDVLHDENYLRLMELIGK